MLCGISYLLAKGGVGHQRTCTVARSTWILIIIRGMKKKSEKISNIWKIDWQQSQINAIQKNYKEYLHVYVKVRSVKMFEEGLKIDKL